MLPSKNFLQSYFENEIPDAFSAKKPTFDVTKTGIPPIDSLIQGFPKGSITEICGTASSGRTALAFSVLAEITRGRQSCAVVDTLDSLHPQSMAVSGIDLAYILWVRCGNAHPDDCLSSKKKLPQHNPNKLSPSFTLAARHPREETRGLSHAVANLMGNNQIDNQGTIPPSSAKRDKSTTNNCTFSHSQREIKSKIQSKNLTAERKGQRLLTRSLWTRLEQTLKVTDLLLHNGGFGAVVMDLGEVPPEKARRIPLASWFRFRHAIESTSTMLILISPEPCASTCASLTLRCNHIQERWEGSTEGFSPGGTLKGLDLRVQVVRQRFLVRPEIQPNYLKKSSDFTDWQACMAWAPASTINAEIHSFEITRKEKHE